MRTAHTPRQVFRPDPLLGWSLTPGAIVDVPYRNAVVQHIGDDGWRVVPESRNGTGPRLAVYGCSFVYGTGLRDSEALTALIQAAFPQITVVNRGIGGHSSVQNLIQFKRDLEAGEVSAAIFGIIGHHRFRNIPHPVRMRMLQSMDWQELGVEHVPFARQNRSGDLVIDYAPIWQPALRRADFDVFLPNEYMIDRATTATLSAIAEAGAQRGVPTQFALLDCADPAFNQGLASAFPTLLDVSTPDDEHHSFRPDDAHPNALANKLFFERLAPRIAEMVTETTLNA